VEQSAQSDGRIYVVCCHEHDTSPSLTLIFDSVSAFIRSMTIRTRISAFIFFLSASSFLHVPNGSAASLANIVIDQVSAGSVGTWTMLAADGSTRTSDTATADPRKYSAGISDFGPMTFSVVPPSGMSARITVYRGGEQVAVTDSRQYSFHVYPNDSYRFVVKYWVGATGTLGVISNPQGIIFRAIAEGGKTYRGVTPASFTNLPVGKYSIYSNPTAACTSSAPQSVTLGNEDRKVITLSMSCDNASGEYEAPVRVRPSKRNIVERVAEREARRKTRHMINRSSTR
jgi:hypothetical protein